MPPFYLEDDFQMSPSGTFREATPAESFRQDVAHMIEDTDFLAEGATEVFANELRAAVAELAATHPAVRSLDKVEVTPEEGNTLALAIYINGDPTAVTLSGLGGT